MHVMVARMTRSRVARSVRGARIVGDDDAGCRVLFGGLFTAPTLGVDQPQALPWQKRPSGCRPCRGSPTPTGYAVNGTLDSPRTFDEWKRSIPERSTS